MEFDWENQPLQPDCSLKIREVEESFEDPFSVRLLPDSAQFSEKARYFNLGKSAGGQGVFSVYRANGKQIQIILARPFEPEESFFYEQQQGKLLNRGNKT